MGTGRITCWDASKKEGAIKPRNAVNFHRLFRKSGTIGQLRADLDAGKDPTDAKVTYEVDRPKRATDVAYAS